MKAVFLLIKRNSPVILISKFVNFLIHDYVNFEKKNVNTGHAFYFIEFEANFQDEFFIGSSLAINILKL